VTVDGRREKASWRLRAGERVVADVPPPPGREVVPEDIPVPVVYEDEELVVVDKPAGMVVHPAPGNWTGTLVNALVGRGQGLADGGGDERPGLVHRIDKDTSGLLVVAKTDRAHRVLSAAVAARRVTRLYATACWGHLADDRVEVDRPVARDPRDRKRMAVVPGGKPARTTFDRLARYDAGDLLRATLHTGRTHQIRVHLASTGHPVLGDDTYGGGGGRRLVALPSPRHFLHAALLRFAHPGTGAEVEFRAPLPPDLRTSLSALAGLPGWRTSRTCSRTLGSTPAVDAGPEEDDDGADDAAPRVLVASLDAGWVGVAAAAVEGVVRPAPVTPLGGTARWVLGVAAVRGRVLAVVDARRLAGAPAADATDPDAWWVVVAHGGRAAAVAGLRVWRVAAAHADGAAGDLAGAPAAGAAPGADPAPPVPGLPAGGVARLVHDSGRGGDALPPALRLLDAAALLDLVHDPTHAP
jgi:23S rRNA pseudouridine1911/1915/1917 synthase